MSPKNMPARVASFARGVMRNLPAATINGLFWERAKWAMGSSKRVVLFSILVSSALILGALVLTSGDGLATSAEVVLRFSELIFVTSLIVAPLALVLPSERTKAMARERDNLRLAFIVSYFLSMACTFVPAWFGSTGLSVEEIFYCGFNSFVLAVMLFDRLPSKFELLGARAWRGMRALATAYFWFVFAFTDTLHIGRDQQSTKWYGISLLLLAIAGLFELISILASRRLHYAAAQAEAANRP